jgi:hypothetical protein
VGNLERASKAIGRPVARSRIERVAVILAAQLLDDTAIAKRSRGADDLQDVSGFLVGDDAGRRFHPDVLVVLAAQPVGDGEGGALEGAAVRQCDLARIVGMEVVVCRGPDQLVRLVAEEVLGRRRDVPVGAIRGVGRDHVAQLIRDRAAESRRVRREACA